MRSSPGSRAAWAAILLAATVSTLSAHRRDEYLQAARLDIGPDRVDVQLDLTPGIALADRVIADVDHDRNGVVSDAEAGAYAAVVQHDTRLEIDGRTIQARFVEGHPATVEAMRNGVGTLYVRWSAALPPLAPGTHHLRFTNGHHQDIGVYLANVVVPASDRIAVIAQDRSVDQRRFTVTYEVKAEQRSAALGRALLLLLAAIAAAAAMFLRRSARPSRT